MIVYLSFVRLCDLWPLTSGRKMAKHVAHTSGNLFTRMNFYDTVSSFLSDRYVWDRRADGRTDECIQQRGLLLGGTHNKVYKQLSQWIWENRDLWMKSYNYQKSTIGELSTNKPILMIGLRGEHAHSGVHHCDVCQIISTKYDRIGQSDVFHHPPQKAL